jgi:tryptophan 2,3-dioxygenase
MDANEKTPVTEVAEWCADRDAETFPYDEVVAHFNRVGKHFVSRDLLVGLDRVRAALADDADARYLQLTRFLDTALDKFDGRYDNPSYLALDQLQLPGADGCPDPRHAQRQRDRLVVLLIADMMRFELAALQGDIDLLPEMRPDSRITAKRCRHGLRAIRPALERLGLGADFDETDPLTAALEVCRAVFGDTSPAERRTLQLTALPVSLVHDEYMFIRALQSYETTFALIAVQLKAAVAALDRGEFTAATAGIEAAAQVLGEASPIWSLVATMQLESFLRFREYTDGASAIQSRNYKAVEATCRLPDQARLDSPAYQSVPEIRERVLAGQRNLADALSAAVGSGLLAPDAQAAVHAAMERFEGAIFKWRKTHHRLAVRMLGERRGTGYTAGVDYLEEGRTTPVFKARCPFGHGSPDESRVTGEVLAEAA